MLIDIKSVSFGSIGFQSWICQWYCHDTTRVNLARTFSVLKFCRFRFSRNNFDKKIYIKKY
jgi:hypothetical protein